MLVVLAFAWLIGAPASGQTVGARAVNGETFEPVRGALAYLLDADGATLRRMITDERGSVLFGTVEVGRYRVRVEMLGMSTQESELFEARPGAVVRQELRLSPRPIMLEGIEVEVDERCRIRPEEGLLVSQVWDEARKALEAADFTVEEGAYLYETLLYERDVGLDTRVVEGEQQTRRRGRMRTPFESLPAEDLIENGFSRSSGSETLYFAPDAAVLLSDVFLDSHCLRLVQGDEDEEAAGLVGLAFEPIGGRRRTVDIAGTLWLDPETAELRWLKYRYRNLDPDISSDEVGGRVDFRRMPEGTWIVPEWWIRVPRVAQRVDFGGNRRLSIAGYHQSGGRVLSVEDDIGRSMGRARSAVIEGIVQDSLGLPLPGARVGVVGANQQVFTNAEGRFRIIRLMEGVYRIRFVDPVLEEMGFVPEPITQEVNMGEATWVVYRMPSLADFLLDACQAEASQDVEMEWAGTGVLAGWVQDARTDEPLPGATVRVAWDNYEVWSGIDRVGFRTRTSSYEASTDNRGFYRICGVPELARLTVVGLYGGVESAGDTLRIAGESGSVKLHKVMLPRPRR